MATKKKLSVPKKDNSSPSNNIPVHGDISWMSKGHYGTSFLVVLKDDKKQKKKKEE